MPLDRLFIGSFFQNSSSHVFSIVFPRSCDGGVVEMRKILFTIIFAVAIIGLNSYGSAVILGETAKGVDTGTLPVEVVTEDAEIIKSLGEGVIYVSARQICTQRMGCTCKHRSWRGDSDTLKKHHPEEDPYDGQDSWSPHLDIKCTKCSANWYCPVWKRFRS